MNNKINPLELIETPPNPDFMLICDHCECYKDGDGVWFKYKDGSRVCEECNDMNECCA